MIILNKSFMLDPSNIKLGIAPIGWTNDDMPRIRWTY
jgi:hypothetical protein